MKNVEILLVEDNDGDARLAMEAMRDGKFANKIHRVRDGEEAMAFLRRGAGFENVARPGLILLDLNLPRMTGREVEVKSDATLRQIPVVILTASRAEEDIARSYDLHANCFVTKPLNLDRFIEVTRAIEDFWLTIVQLPAAGETG